MKLLSSLCLFVVYILLKKSEGKIVYLNGTEVYNGRPKAGNITIPSQRWISVFNPRNISNHSGLDSKPVSLTVHRKNDEEKVEENKKVEEIKKDEEIKNNEGEQTSNTNLTTRDTTVLSSLRGIWSDLSPMLTVLSTILGIFFMFVIMESPLSPLPVPPLPHSPVGPYPPTNMYPYGIPPPRNHYGMGYVGPSAAHASYRIPRQMRSFMNKTENNEFLRMENQRYLKERSINGWPDLLKEGFDSLISEFKKLTSDEEFLKNMYQIFDSSLHPK
ncbi:uncharacterized protein [Parasteatoda tepidariorum]|uniref:uncharacterized protein isoform X2 n=1 Tax=Parasteatoda tepidariorum TaxID=114398 RepID=UPI00077FD4B3|nr:uncharacterized protein LOC107445925 isoform X2 [Parasteatoda tepidariorum]